MLSAFSLLYFFIFFLGYFIITEYTHKEGKIIIVYNLLHNLKNLIAFSLTYYGYETQNRKEDGTMSYAFVDIQKVKSFGQLSAKNTHNCRLTDIDNVISELSGNNEDLVPLPQKDGHTMSYVEAWNQRMKDVTGGQNRNVRKNAVLAYEVVLTYSRDESIDVERWKQENVKWLKKIFDVAPDKKSNILHMVYHADETGNVHCHAIIVPIDNRGHLNAKYFTNGSKAMSALQTSYGEAMKPLGLQRGVAGSSARHQDIRKMYATLNNAITLPEVQQGETAKSYKERVEEDIQIRYAVAKKSIDDAQAKHTRKMDEERNFFYNELKNEVQANQTLIQNETKGFNAKKKKLQEEISEYEKMIEQLQKDILEEKLRYQNREQQQEKLEFYDALAKGLELVGQTNPEEAAVLQENIEAVAEIGAQAIEQGQDHEQ